MKSLLALTFALLTLTAAGANAASLPQPVKDPVPVADALPGKNGLIVFNLDNRDRSGDYSKAPSGIYTLNPRTLKRKLLVESKHAYGPQFSPNGDRIIFVDEVERESGIYTMRPNGSGLKKLFSDGTSGFDPVFTPGGRIRFSSDWGNATTTMAMDGSDVQTRQRPEGAVDPVFGSATQNGRKIAYSSCLPSGNNCDIFLLNRNTGENRRLTDGPKQESEAQISPDGKRIVYLKAVKDPRRNQLRNQVWVMRANGAKKKFLGWATGDYHVDEVSFSPDSKSLIVNQGDGGLGSNLIIDPLGRGKNREVRVEGPVWLTDADWQSR